jgi:hypothetical protein
MITRKLGVLAFLTIATISSSLAEEAWVIREDGAGPVKIGMRLSQLNTVLHEKFSLPDEEALACFSVNPTRHPRIAFMIIDDRLARIDLLGAGIFTAAGVQVGDSEARALQVYGSKLKVEPHKYMGSDGHYLTVQSNDHRYGIRFETVKGKITAFYAGRFDAIQFVEGCE